MINQDLPIQENLTIPASELRIQVSTSGGPGGQHANKTSTKVTLRWNPMTSQVLQEYQKQRIITKLQNRMTVHGELIVHASNTRSQSSNAILARERLANLIKEALHKPKFRKKTKLPKSVKEKRITTKKHRAQTKKNRKKLRPDD